MGEDDPQKIIDICDQIGLDKNKVTVDKENKLIYFTVQITPNQAASLLEQLKGYQIYYINTKKSGHYYLKEDGTLVRESEEESNIVEQIQKSKSLIRKLIELDKSIPYGFSGGYLEKRVKRK